MVIALFNGNTDDLLTSEKSEYSEQIEQIARESILRGIKKEVESNNELTDDQIDTFTVEVLDKISNKKDHVLNDVVRVATEKVRRRVNFGFRVAEAVILITGTFIWGFGDLLGRG